MNKEACMKDFFELTFLTTLVVAELALQAGVPPERKTSRGRTLKNSACETLLQMSHVADFIKEDLWSNPLTYFNNEVDGEDSEEEKLHLRAYYRDGQTLTKTCIEVLFVAFRCSSLFLLCC